MIEFKPHPLIAPCKSKFDPSVHETYYKYDYEAVFSDIARGEVEQIPAFRSLIRNDLFFILFFVMEIPIANHPFPVEMCHMVEDGPDSDTLDVWARYHMKSTTITQGETIKYIVNNPELCHCILSYKKPAAEKFLMAIKETLEKPFMKACFPDILYERETESTSWSVQNGIRVKRQSVSRPQHTVEAYGLLEGMPTGGHWDRLVFDDVETEDLARSPDQMMNLIKAYDMAQNLGMPTGTIIRVIGTFYTHCGLLTHLRDKKDINGGLMYQFRKVPATDDGTINGKPVFMAEKEFNKFKTLSTFNSQQLCDPTPTEDITLNFSYLNPIEPKLIPKDVIKLMMVDQAGDKAVQTSGKDIWSFGVIGVKPNYDDICTSDVYIFDVECGQMEHSEAISAIVQMYIRNGMILQLGVEKVALSTTEIHIANALKARGRHLSRDNGNLVDLKPAGRSTENRVKGALQWPLNNGKMFISNSIPTAYVERIKEEMDKFPVFHSEVLNMLAYGYDMMRDNPYLKYYMGDDEEEEGRTGNVIDIRGRSAIGGY